jgi:hypothetical protein
VNTHFDTRPRPEDRPPHPPMKWSSSSPDSGHDP